MTRKTTRNRIASVMIRMLTPSAWAVGVTGGGSQSVCTPPVEEGGDSVDAENGTTALGPLALLLVALALLAGVAVAMEFHVSWQSATKALLLCVAAIALLASVGPKKEEDEQDDPQRRP